MSDTTMRERVARALCKAQGDDPDSGTRFGLYDVPKWPGLLYLADAAIHAMREPTADMCEAGAISKAVVGHRAQNIYTDMIDTALSRERGI